ncbi:MAG: amino acid permease [Parvularculaceae bacterium]|nr:amino acid permease [Parvularculaceae bacterium]
MSDIFRRKTIDSMIDEKAPDRLQPTLSAWHLVLLGVGAIVGTGIYTLVGVGAERAGPAVMVSFAVAGLICVFAALAYAELATMIPASGSAYTYSYASMGELVAWLVGWALILEYSVVCSAVAVGWSGYASGFLLGMGVELPALLTAGPAGGGVVNLPAVAIVAAVTGMLLIGIRESANVNAVLVIVKIVALAIFVALALPAFDAANFEPFSPYGFAAHKDAAGADRGVMSAAAIIFFAFYGFDAVSTAAEETKDPGRNLSIGIIGSMLVCTLIYMTVATAAVGALPFGDFATSSEPLAFILRSLGHDGAAAAIAVAAVIALPTVILAFMYGQSRIFFTMARDGLLPRRFGAVDKKSGTPVAMTILTGVVCAALAGVLPLATIAELANAGTLCAFIATAVALMILRVREPNRHRPFKAPFGFIVAIGAILGCLYLFSSLPIETQTRFFIWMATGVVVYFVFRKRA